MTGSGAWALFIIVAVNTLFVIGLTAALYMINRKLGELSAKMDPLTARASETLGRVDQLTQEVETRAQKLLELTTSLVENVAKKVDTTTAIAEETVSQPLIGAASVMAGLSRGMQVYREQAEEKGDSN